MKSAIKIFLFMVGAIYTLSLFGCSDNFKYERYSCKNPALDFTIDRISGWQSREQIGSFGSFAQIGFYEPAREIQRLLAMMVVTVEDNSGIKFVPQNIDGMSNDLIKKRMLFDSSRVISKTGKKMLGEDAIDIELSYRTLEKLGSAHPRLLPYRERIIIFARSGKFYTVRYANFADNFDKYSKAFDHIVRSIKFK